MDLVAVVETTTNVTIATGWKGQTFDGQSIAPYDIVFLGAQSDSTQIGPYTAHPSGKLIPSLSSLDGADTVEIRSGSNSGHTWQPIRGVWQKTESGATPFYSVQVPRTGNIADINAAIAACPDAGGNIYVPTYITTPGGVITITRWTGTVGLHYQGKNNVRLYGDGMKLTVIDCDVPQAGLPKMTFTGFEGRGAAMLVEPSAINGTVSGLQIENLTLYSRNTASDFDTHDNALLLGHSFCGVNLSDFVFRNVEFDGGFSIPTIFYITDTTRRSKGLFDHCVWRNTADALITDNPTCCNPVTSLYSEWEFRSCTFEDVYYGLLLTGDSHNVHHCYFSRVKYAGAQIGESDTDTSRSLGGTKFNDNIFTGLGFGSVLAYNSAYGVNFVTRAKHYADGTEDSGNECCRNTFLDTYASGQPPALIRTSGPVLIEGNRCGPLAADSAFSTGVAFIQIMCGGHGTADSPIKVICRNNTLEMPDPTGTPTSYGVTNGIQIGAWSNLTVVMSGNHIDTHTGSGNALAIEAGAGEQPDIELENERYKGTWQIDQGVVKSSLSGRPISGRSGKNVRCEASRDITRRTMTIPASGVVDVRGLDVVAFDNSSAIILRNLTGDPGQEIEIWGLNTNVTITNAVNFAIQSNWTSAVNSFIKLRYDAVLGYWNLVNRQANGAIVLPDAAIIALTDNWFDARSGLASHLSGGYATQWDPSSGAEVLSGPGGGVLYTASDAAFGGLPSVTPDNAGRYFSQVGFALAGTAFSLCVLLSQKTADSRSSGYSIPIQFGGANLCTKFAASGGVWGTLPGLGVERHMAGAFPIEGGTPTFHVATIIHRSTSDIDVILDGVLTNFTGAGTSPAGNNINVGGSTYASENLTIASVLFKAAAWSVADQSNVSTALTAIYGKGI